MTEHVANGSAARRELIAFRVGEQVFCVDIMAVREIRGWTPATPLPRAPDYVRGVINLRGAVLPIVDLGSRLGLQTTEATARHVIMVVHLGGRAVGLLVDAVSDIVTIPDDMVQPTPDIASEQVKTFVRGLFALDGKMVSLIALDKVLPEPEAEAA
jgi:purine-binding chemotaxis protein CheW